MSLLREHVQVLWEIHDEDGDMMKKVSADICRCLCCPYLPFLRVSVLIEDLLDRCRKAVHATYYMCFAVVGS